MVTQVVVLDAGPVGLLSNPQPSSERAACAQWLYGLMANAVRIIVPEISDYEIRRELLRAKKSKGIAHLDSLARSLEYLPITTAAMRQAALFWAQARQLDADMILAGQATTIGVSIVVVATTNVGHLARFVPADQWQNIKP